MTQTINCDIILVTEDMVQAQWLDGNMRTFNINGLDDLDFESGMRQEKVYIIDQDVLIVARYLNEAL